jgi:hypothetical protein
VFRASSSLYVCGTGSATGKCVRSIAELPPADVAGDAPGGGDASPQALVSKNKVPSIRSNCLLLISVSLVRIRTQSTTHI